MKILLVSNLYPPQVIGGAELYVQSLARELSKYHQVTILTTGRAGLTGLWRWYRQTDDRVAIYRFTPLNFSTPFSLRDWPAILRPLWHVFDLWNIQSWLMVRRAIHDIQPDIVHTHNVSGISGAVWSAVGPRPIIHTLHDYHLLSPWAILFRNHQVVKAFAWWESLYQAIYRRLTERIHFVTAPSEFVINLHRQHGFFPGAETASLPLGIEVPAQLRHAKSQTPLLVFMGQITEYKGIGVMLAAMRLLPNLPVRVVIAGRGPELDRYQAMTDDPRVEWAGFVSGAVKQQLLASAWATLVPSIWYDNSPVSIYESLAAGTPVIGSHIGGIPELVKPRETGWLVPPGDAAALAQIIAKVSAHPEVAAELGKNAQTAMMKLTLSQHAETMVRQYATLLSSSMFNHRSHTGPPIRD